MQNEAFDLELLGKVNEVKDTTQKCPLTVHLVRLMIEKFSDSTDLFSELPHVHRVAAKVASYVSIKCVYVRSHKYTVSHVSLVSNRVYRCLMFLCNFVVSTCTFWYLKQLQGKVRVNVLVIRSAIAIRCFKFFSPSYHY